MVPMKSLGRGRAREQGAEEVLVDIAIRNDGECNSGNTEEERKLNR